MIIESGQNRQTLGNPTKKAIDMIVTNATPTITNRLFIIKCEIY